MRYFMFSIIIAVFIGFGCRSSQNDVGDSLHVKKAVAVLKPIHESGVKGIVYFTEKGGILEIIADIKGLSRGEYGFHIHQFGDLASEDASSTGFIYRPENFINEKGDSLTKTMPENLGNIYALNDSLAQMEKEIYSLELNGENSIIGRSVVVHEREDDYTSQPCGNAGKILAAGIIGIALE